MAGCDREDGQFAREATHRIICRCKGGNLDGVIKVQGDNVSKNISQGLKKYIKYHWQAGLISKLFTYIKGKGVIKERVGAIRDQYGSLNVQSENM